MHFVRQGHLWANILFSRCGLTKWDVNNLPARHEGLRFKSSDVVRQMSNDIYLRHSTLDLRFNILKEGKRDHSNHC